MEQPQARFADAVDNSNRPFEHNMEHVNNYLVSGIACAASLRTCLPAADVRVFRSSGLQVFRLDDTVESWRD